MNKAQRVLEIISGVSDEMALVVDGDDVEGGEQGTEGDLGSLDAFKQILRRIEAKPATAQAEYWKTLAYTFSDLIRDLPSGEQKLKVVLKAYKANQGF